MADKKAWAKIIVYVLLIGGIILAGQSILQMKTIPKHWLYVCQYLSYFSMLLVTLIFSKESVSEYKGNFSTGLFTKNVKIGLIIFGIIFFIFIFLTNFGVFKLKLYMSVPKFLYVIFSQICIVGASEEIVFRGFLLREISRITTNNIGIFLSSVIFGLIHINSGIRTVILAFSAGIILAVLRREIKISLTSLAIAHGLTNVLFTLIYENAVHMAG